LINPGNPTGNHFTVETLKAVAGFCEQERVLLLADEVYQSNIYDGQRFVSMKQIFCEYPELSFTSFISGIDLV
jgi:alanine transaminase